MGLAAEIEFERPTANGFQRLQQNIAASRAGSAIYGRTLDPIDRGLYRLTGGRVTVPGLMAGLPLVMLTTTGARSGTPRTVPLLGIPWGDDLAVLNVNFGREGTPGWWMNLNAQPRARVGHAGHEVEVDATALSPDEVTRATAEGTRGFAAYPNLYGQISSREVRGFALSAAR